MSFGVVRGRPTASQLFFDGVLREVAGGGGAVEKVTLPQVVLHCLRKNPEDVFMINAATGEKFTNGQILKHAVSVARALVAAGAREKNVMIVMRNHECTAAVYFAVMFAGSVPFIMDPNTTVLEVAHYLRVVEPCVVFCDSEHEQTIGSALEELPGAQAEVRVSDREDLLLAMTRGYSGDAADFQVPSVDVESTVMMLPTSGSTGMPKATLMSHKGLVINIPHMWTYHSQFPTPTALCMLLTTPQWVTFSMTTLACVVYRTPVLMSPRAPSVPWVQHMLTMYRPSWTFFGPAFLMTLLPVLSSDQLTSLETVYLLGAASSIEMKTAFKKILPPTCVLGDVYGSTESQGFITQSPRGAPLKSTGIIVNTLEYKLLDENMKEVGLGEKGELFVRGPTLFKGYYKSPEETAAAFVDGWLQTGDAFSEDDQQHVYYLERRKFCFKYLGSHVSPEEVELAIGAVAGVRACVVADSAAGPAALVVGDRALTRDHIHRAVDASLSHHKRLHGGIAFVPRIPLTHSGKIKRKECRELMHQLIATGQCVK